MLSEAGARDSRAQSEVQGDRQDQELQEKMGGMALNGEARTGLATTGYLEVETKGEDEDRYQDRYESHNSQQAAMGAGHHHNEGGSSASGYYDDDDDYDQYDEDDDYYSDYDD